MKDYVWECMMYLIFFDKNVDLDFRVNKIGSDPGPTEKALQAPAKNWLSGPSPYSTLDLGRSLHQILVIFADCE